MLLTRQALTRPALELAPQLLGAVVVSTVGDLEVAVRITELEAYEGIDDPASHAYKGPTPRTAVMFGPAGYLYCYFSYGMHWCANIVCDVNGRASAVLMRGGEIVRGLPTARGRRPAAKRDRDLARGPARLASSLALGERTKGVDLLDSASPVRLESVPAQPIGAVESGPRVGISKAAGDQWRFWIAGDPTVSAYRASTHKPGARG